MIASAVAAGAARGTANEEKMRVGSVVEQERAVLCVDIDRTSLWG